MARREINIRFSATNFLHLYLMLAPNCPTKVGHVYITIDLLSEQFRRVIQNCVCRHVVE